MKRIALASALASSCFLTMPARAADPPAVEFAAAARPLAGVPTALAAMAFNGRDGGTLAAFVTAMPMPAASGPTPVPFVIEVDGAALVGSADAKRLTVEFFAYILDDNHRVRGHFAQEVRFDLEQSGAALFENSLKFFGHLELSSGSYVARFLVREPRSERFALRSVRIEIPEPGKRFSIPVGLVFPDADPSWILAREARPGSGPGPAVSADADQKPKAEAASKQRLEGLLESYVALGSETGPSALPVLYTGAEQTADLFFLGLTPPGDSVGVRLVDNSGKGVADVELVPEEKPVAVAPRFYRRRVRFTVPEVPDGGYVLQIQGEEARNRVHPMEQPVIVAPAVSESRVTWKVLGAPATASPGGAEAAPSRGRLGSKEARRIAEEYRTVLGQVVNGAQTEAIARLAEIEREVSERIETEPERVLARAELHVAMSLADSDPETLLPLVSLHAGLDALHREERRFLLASHARRMTVTLAERYADRVGTQEARAVVSQILTLLAAELQELQLWSNAQKLFERALEYDPENRSAILSIALGLEKRGSYAGAINYLERLIKLDPKTAEGRLRLALNLDRVDKDERAAQVLRRILAEDNPPWTLSVAYQERAKMLLDSGQAAAAVELLEDGVARLPGERRLYVMWAFALDRIGDRKRAGAAALSALRLPAAAGPSSRFLYNQPSRADRERIRQELDRNSIFRLSALAAALDGSGSGRSSRAGRSRRGRRSG